jgi:hypothetical protein
MPHNDLVAVSYYPFFVKDAERLAALDWLLESFDSFKKSYAMVETNDAAECLPLPQAKVVIEGTPEKQLAYGANGARAFGATAWRGPLSRTGASPGRHGQVRLPVSSA